nr:hypothetical protein [Tanacetum cinerariifolium]
VHEPEVKGISSSNSSTQTMDFVSSSNNNNTNGAVNTGQAVNTANGVSTANTQVNVAFSSNIDNLNDAIAMLTMRARRFLMKTGKKLTINGNETIGFDKSNASATIATKWDTFLGSAELQEIKIPSTRKAQEGVCLWKHLLPQLWCHVMVLVDMIGVIKLKEDQIMHSWHSHLQVLTQRYQQILLV